MVLICRPQDNGGARRRDWDPWWGVPGRGGFWFMILRDRPIHRISPLLYPRPHGAIHTPHFPNQPMMRSLRVFAFTLLAVPLALTGCDAIEEAAGLNDIDVPLGSAGRGIPVEAGTFAYQSGTINISQNIPGSPGVDGIGILARDVTFRAAALRGGSAGTCDLNVTLLIDNAPAVDGSVSIVDDEVDAVSVNYASPDYDRARLCEAIGAETCPVGELTRDAIDDIVEDALNSGTFDIGVVVDNPGDGSGELDIESVNFDLNL